MISNMTFAAVVRSVGAFGRARKDWVFACATRNCVFQRALYSRTPSVWETKIDDNEPDFPNPMVKVAILGPPNAGKSTLFNRLLDKELNRTYKLSSEKDKGNRRRKQKTGRAGRFAARHAKKKYAAGNAIVSPVSGTTRDRREGIGRIGGQYFQLVDTAGVDGERLDHFFDVQKTVNEKKQEKPPPTKRRKKSDKPVTILKSPNPREILKPMMQQALLAAQEAHLVFLMFDARVGLTADFHETARWLRKHATSNKMKQLLNKKDMHKPVILKKRARVVILANKLEGKAGEFLLQDDWEYDMKDEYRSPIQDNMVEAMRTGFDEVIAISALHGEGITDIALEIAKTQQELTKSVHAGEGETHELDQDELYPWTWKEKPLQLAVLGRVNVGKSTLVNSLLKQERCITGPTPGLTRDSISIPWLYGRDKRPVQLVDTAGLRKKPSQRTDDEIEDMAVLDALRAMKIADVAILVLDAQAKYLQRHELSIAQAVLQEGRALVIVANKMDLLLNEEYTRRDFERGVRRQLEDSFPMLRMTPIIAVSSLYGRAVEDIMPAVFDARRRWERKISTAQLNRWMSEVVQEYAPPSRNGVPTKIKYMIQTKGRPPTFLLFCNTTELPDSYLRYLTRHFQESFDF